ncbi:MAG: CoA transferase [Candidatus Lambdaproteobacteria bacterium]|nr:CoA transferase [Candidatus Lambdaproteobacteria bacterium]
MAQGLAGLKVIELGGGVSAAYAGKLMADLGAEVVKIEPPGGEPGRLCPPFRAGAPDPEGSGTFLYLNTNKRSLVLDLARPEERAGLDELARRADLLIHNLSRKEMAAQGIEFERLSALNPRLVLLSVTPFGLTGPYRDYVGNDLVLVHGGGWGWICPGPGTDPARPPLKPFGHHGVLQAGIHGALAALAMHYGTLHGAPGEHVDCSIQEVQTGYLGRAILDYSYLGKIDSRLSARKFAPAGFYQTADSQIVIVCVEEDQWQRVAALMGNPAWTRRPEFATRELRGENFRAFNPLVEAWTRQWNTEALYLKCQEHKIGSGPVFRYEQLLGFEHLKARGFATPLDHPRAGRLILPGAPYALTQPWWKLRRAAPLLGEAQAERERLLGGGTPAAAAAAPALPAALRPGAGQPPLPLAGVRVLDFTWVWAGPYCTMYLANLGAEVIKVESASRLDHARRVKVYPQGMEGSINRSGYFNEWNQGKKSLGLSLSDPKGIELVKRLVPSCDVVMSNFATGVMERLGLGHEELHRINPQLVVAAISGYGQTGPWKNFTAYGSAVVPLSGVSASTGYPDDNGLAQEVGIAYGDNNAGIYAAYAIVAALVARKRQGGGQYIDISMWESMIATGFDGWMNYALGNPPYPTMGNRDPAVAPHNLYRCVGEDTWLALACETEEQWQALCSVMGRALGGMMGQPGLAGDPRFRDRAARKANEDALDALIGAWCAGQERWALTHTLQAAGVPAFPSLSAKDLVENEHLKARNYFTRLSHAEVGVRTHVGIPWRLTRRRNGVRTPAPLFGADTDEVARLAGLDEAEIAALRARKVLQ